MHISNEEREAGICLLHITDPVFSCSLSLRITSCGDGGLWVKIQFDQSREIRFSPTEKQRFKNILAAIVRNLESYVEECDGRVAMRGDPDLEVVLIHSSRAWQSFASHRRRIRKVLETSFADGCSAQNTVSKDEDQRIFPPPSTNPYQSPEQP